MEFMNSFISILDIKFAHLLSPLFMLLVLAGCGANLPYQLSRSEPNVVSKSGGPLLIKLPSTESQIQDLSEGNGKPSVIFYAQELCISCTEELEMVKRHLKDPSVSPSNVNLYSVLLGSDLSSARDWKKEHGVPWQVLFDTAATSINQYCPKPILPCVIVHTPTEGVVLVEQKVVSFEEIFKWTGDWEN